MKRRDFITLLSGAATWPLAARAQQPERMRHIGVLMSNAEDDPEGQARVQAFRRGLDELGWSEGRNIRIDDRWTAGVAESAELFAGELIAAAPDVIVANGTPSVPPLARRTTVVPIVFIQVSDPVEQGFVSSLSRPGNNMTGFSSFEFSMGGKWVQALKEVSPQLKRVAVVFNPQTTPFAEYVRSVESAAATFDVSSEIAPARHLEELRGIIDKFGQEPGCGLIFPPDPFVTAHRDTILAIVLRQRIPAIYPFRYFVASGGLMSYGLDPVDLFRRAAVYIDRILKGAEAADLPVQLPTKFELVINLKTAKALGLTVPTTLLARADDVIE